MQYTNYRATQHEATHHSNEQNRVPHHITHPEVTRHEATHYAATYFTATHDPHVMVTYHRPTHRGLHVIEPHMLHDLECLHVM